MSSSLSSLLFRLTRRHPRRDPPPPLLVELFGGRGNGAPVRKEAFPFTYDLENIKGVPFYTIHCDFPPSVVPGLRTVVHTISSALEPSEVVPLEFEKLVEVLEMRAAGSLPKEGVRTRIREMAELCAFEAIGMSRILAFAKDSEVSEVFVDSDSSPVYLDHSKAGRCETEIMLTERERQAIETHLDTFGGYTADLRTPSLKNDLQISGGRFRVSLDLQPVSVNRFALDMRRLGSSDLSLPKLISMGVLTLEAASFLVGWLEAGGNVTIVGETGTGKTTLLNALDGTIEPRLRRLYIEDSVETLDLLGKGFHQLKVKVDPFDRGADSFRTKESEIVKSLHRSPDMVILSEVQSEEHSRAFFHALSAGARGMQTFHASTIEQALQRWEVIHHIAPESLLELGVLVQMSRPDRLGPQRYVQRICSVVSVDGKPGVMELFRRGNERLARTAQGLDDLSVGKGREVLAATRRSAEGRIAHAMAGS